MRFALKTAPERTTWADMLAMWRHRLELGLGAAWNTNEAGAYASTCCRSARAWIASTRPAT